MRYQAPRHDQQKAHATVDFGKTTTCPECKGTGWRTVKAQITMRDNKHSVEKKCLTCNGTSVVQRSV